MKRFLAGLAAAIVLSFPALPTPARTKTANSTAQPTCSAGDPVVWVNTRTKVYHLKGDAYYGTTKSGMYACKSDAEAKGAHLAGGGKMTSDPSPAASPVGMSKKHRKHAKGGATPAPSPTP